MNIIEEIESLKGRIDAEVREHQRQLDLLAVAASKIGHKVSYIKLTPEQQVAIAATPTPVQTKQAPIPEPVEVPKKETSSPPVSGGRKKVTKVTKRRYLTGAMEKTLRAISMGNNTATVIAKVVYGTETREDIKRAKGLLYYMEKNGRASSTIVREKTEEVRAWSLTPKGKSLLENTGS